MFHTILDHRLMTAEDQDLSWTKAEDLLQKRISGR